MTLSKNIWFWMIVLLLAALSLYSISNILLPFIAGTFIAYAMHPAVTFFESLKVRRTFGTLLMIFGFIIIISLLLMVLIPFITNELVILAASLPSYGQRLMETVLPLFENISDYIGEDLAGEFGDVRAKAAEYLSNVFSWSLRFLAGLLTNSLALANLVTLIVITPVITFYMLRDWPKILSTAQSLVPESQKDTFKDLAIKINSTLGGYVRGQSLVCLIQAFTYSIGLWLVGLDYALTIGIVTGLLSFIPYLGMLIGVVVGMGIAIAQFDNWLSVGLVALVFTVGNIFEGQILAPALVGGRIGLHPVWLIFALLAGGTLFGFMGLLFAMPVAAALGVLVRHFTSLYRQSDLYLKQEPINTPKE